MTKRTRVSVLAVGWALVVAMGHVAAGWSPAMAGQTATPKPAGRIAGRVTAGDTKQPLPAASLRLISFERRVQKSARTDAEGRFEFTELPAGRYELRATADLYVATQYGQGTTAAVGRPIDLGVDEHFDRAEIVMPRTSAVEGLVVDEYGDPVPGIQIGLSRLEYVAGRQRLLPVSSAGQTARPTDDRGYFRVAGFAPGTYYVTALSGAFAERDDVAGFATTYFPSATDPAAATPVTLAAGEDVTGVTIALIPAPTVTIRGRLVDETDGPVARGTVMLVVDSQSEVMPFTIARTGSAADGSFEFRQVPRGEYVIQGFGPPVGGGNLGRSPFGSVRAAVDDTDRTDLIVRVDPGVVLRGRIVFEGTSPRPRPDQVRVSPFSVDFVNGPVGGGPNPYEIGDDWRFELRNQVGVRVIRAQSADPAWTLDRVLVEGRNIIDTPVDFRKGPLPELEIVFTDRGASLEGRVSSMDGKAIDQTTVLLFAADESRWAFPSRVLNSTRPSQDGRFRLRNVPPGTYYAIAVPAQPDLGWQDPARLRAWRPVATLVTLGIGETRTLDLHLVER